MFDLWEVWAWVICVFEHSEGCLGHDGVVHGGLGPDAAVGMSEVELEMEKKIGVLKI